MKKQSTATVVTTSTFGVAPGKVVGRAAKIVARATVNVTVKGSRATVITTKNFFQGFMEGFKAA